MHSPSFSFRPTAQWCRPRRIPYPTPSRRPSPRPDEGGGATRPGHCHAARGPQARLHTYRSGRHHVLPSVSADRMSAVYFVITPSPLTDQRNLFQLCPTAFADFRDEETLCDIVCGVGSLRQYLRIHFLKEDFRGCCYSLSGSTR